MVDFCDGQMEGDGRPFVSPSDSYPQSTPHRSQSRMRGDYLFYEEKIETTQEERDAKAARR